MQFLKGYDLQTLLASDEPKVCLYLLSDPETHPLLNSLSCINALIESLVIALIVLIVFS